MKPESFDLDLFKPVMHIPLNLSASSLAPLVAFQGVDFDSRLCSTSFTNCTSSRSLRAGFDGVGLPQIIRAQVRYSSEVEVISGRRLMPSFRSRSMSCISWGMQSLPVMQLKISHEASQSSDDAWRTSYTCGRLY